MTDDIKRDLLEAPRKLNAGDQFDAYTLLLREMKLAVRELRKTHPSQRAVVRVDISGPDPRYLTSIADIAHVTFFANGNQVKAQYIIISLNREGLTSFTINEPLRMVVNGVSNGIILGDLLGGRPNFIDIHAEVEYLEFGIPSSTINQTVEVQGSAKGISMTGQGAISVYAWTIPEASYEDI